MESIIQNVKDIETSQKRWLEEALGQKLLENQFVMIRVMNAGVAPSDETRALAMDDLQRLVSQANSAANEKSVTAQEADAAVVAVIEHVRGQSS